jgi:long-chain acyl-CoA synthetase
VSEGSVLAGTVIGRFLQRAEERGSQPLWYYQLGGRWHPISWAEAKSEVVGLAAGLASIGIAPGDRVGLVGPNRPGWVMADYAIQHLGAVVVPLYDTSPPDQITHVLSRTGARVCLADGEELVGRIREASLPGLGRVVALHRDEEEDGAVMGRAALIRRGENWLAENPQGLSQRLAALDSDQVATVIFTSGTDGDPKGAALTHRNLIWAAEAGARAVRVRNREITLSYLPLAHAFERVVTTVIPLVASTSRWTCWFVEEIDKLPGALRSVRPTIFVAVPLVWARMQSRIRAEMQAGGITRRTLARLAVTAGESAVRRRDDERAVPAPARLGAGIARFQGGRVLKKIGLGRCWYAVSGAAPLPPETQQFFQALGLPLHQGWGLTETAALCTVQRPDDLQVGVVGAPLDGVEIRLGMDGEVLVRGPNLFVGYEAEPQRSAEVIDRDGFFHTGDVGRLADGGRLEIIDRLKDVIITAGGRKVAPWAIEERLRADPLIAGAMVLGEGRPYLIALISLDGDQAAALVGGHDEETGLWEHPTVQAKVARAVAVLNRSRSAPEQVHRFAIVPFGFPDEALTPTLKLKRRVVEETFAATIEGLYA